MQMYEGRIQCQENIQNILFAILEISVWLTKRRRTTFYICMCKKRKSDQDNIVCFMVEMIPLQKSSWFWLIEWK